MSHRGQSSVVPQGAHQFNPQSQEAEGLAAMKTTTLLNGW
jgi:hypothetical protein